MYGVNERGSRAVLITALAGSVPSAAGLPPLPLAGLLLVIGPGFELAISVLNRRWRRMPPGRRAADPAAASAAQTPARPKDRATKAASKRRTPSSRKTRNQDDEQKAHDAAIAELLSGVDDALYAPAAQAAAGRPD